jgi:hypothetical protein
MKDHDGYPEAHQNDNPNALCTTGQIRTHQKNHQTTKFLSSSVQDNITGHHFT